MYIFLYIIIIIIYRNCGTIYKDTICYFICMGFILFESKIYGKRNFFFSDDSDLFLVELADSFRHLLFVALDTRSRGISSNDDWTRFDVRSSLISDAVAVRLRFDLRTSLPTTDRFGLVVMWELGKWMLVLLTWRAMSRSTLSYSEISFCGWNGVYAHGRVYHWL